MGKNKEWEPFSPWCKFTSFSGHTGCYVTATCRGDKSLCVYRSGDKLLKQVAWQSQQQIALCELENFCENLRLSNWILLQQIAQIQSDSILWDLLLWQNSVEETKIFTKISCTNKENCHCDVSKQCVAVTCLFQYKVNSLKILANPKSQSFITPSLVIRMFSGFTSLWTHWKKTQKTLSMKHA